ncbi:Plasmid stabilization system protein ParE [Rhizobiales bacterium GAS188]|nr:Plasmid stabilization system protein ParE [Rhizobiales bacterium GAS188]
MSARPIVPRERARRDIEEAVDYYAREAGEQVALGFIDAVDRAYRTISNNPAAGSTRYAHELNLPGLRSRSLKRYPYLVFYVETISLTYGGYCTRSGTSRHGCMASRTDKLSDGRGPRGSKQPFDRPLCVEADALGGRAAR